MGLLRRLFCEHEYEWDRNIYGEEIELTGGKRSWWCCKKCGRYQLRDDLHEEEPVTTWLDDLHEEQGMTEGAKEIYDRMVDGLDKQEDLVSDDGWTVESWRFDKVAQRQRGAMAELQMEYEKLRAQNDKLLPKVERQASELTKLRLALEQRNDDLRAYKAQCRRLVRENHELRELVRDCRSFARMMYMRWYEQCEAGDDVDQHLVDACAYEMRQLDDRMYKLGIIEVGE